MAEESGNDHDQQHQPLLRRHSSRTDRERPNHIQRAIRLAFKSTASLANLLPTGTVFAFRLLSPIFSNQGKCDEASEYLTAGLVIICGLSCFLSCFTDSFKDENGELHYGIATCNGLWVIDGSATLPPEQAPEYRLKVIDFLHAFMSTLVFATIALSDQNVVSCFYPKPSEETSEVLTAIPVGLGVFASAFFVTFPTTRHGIGYPVS